MLTFIKLAWRNLLRNRRRTVISGLAIGVGLGALMLTDAMMRGTINSMVSMATSSFMGQAQIHRFGFRQSRDVQLTIAGPEELLSALRRDPMVKDFAPRTFSLAMISSPANVAGVELVGVDPPSERGLSKFDDALRQGDYFGGDDPHDIVIGSKLAEVLEVGLGDRTVVTVSQAFGGSLSQEMFRVSGIFDMGDRAMNSGLALVRLSQAQEMMGLGENIHEVALRFTDLSLSRDTLLPFWSHYSQGGNEALSWIKIMPQIKSMIDLSGISTLIMAVVLMGVVAFVILNTLFMSLFERTFELGVLRALGTRAGGIAWLLLCEAGSLALVSIAIGVALGTVSILLFGAVGIKYTGAEFYGLTFNEAIRPELHPSQFAIYTAWVFVFTVLIGVYPAVHAARIAPAQAMRKSF